MGSAAEVRFPTGQVAVTIAGFKGLAVVVTLLPASGAGEPGGG